MPGLKALVIMVGVILSSPPALCAGFEDVTLESGISFFHYNGASGEKYPIETMLGGCAFLDADGDGDLDLYAVNGAPIAGESAPEAPLNRLYRNDGVESGWSFTDITEISGAGDPGYGNGCAVADYDNDGDADIYVTNYGANVLLRNDGRGIFQDVTDEAGVGDSGWGMSAAFLDIEGDGDLDLYVANYVDFRLDDNRFCALRSLAVRAYCHPDVFPGRADVLYRNEGDGTFTDITRAAGVYKPEGKGLGVVCTDIDLDGDVDIYVANDSMENYLFLNNGDGAFEETGLLSGAAFNAVGHSEAGMGVDAGDLDADGYPDILIGHLDTETNTYYRNLGDGTFQDITTASGMAAPTLMMVTFGLVLLDADNDGDSDAFTANGHVLDNIELVSGQVPYRQTNQLFVNDGAGRFVDATVPWGLASMAPKASRGVAAGDYDNDGRVDLFVANVADRYDLLRNRASDEETGGPPAHWLLVKLIGGAAARPGAGFSNADGIGARVTVTTGRLRQTKEVRSGSSYLSASDLRLHFGLGEHDRVETMEIRWPSGLEERYEDIAADRILEVREGRGISGP